MLPLATTTFTVKRVANDGTVDLVDATTAPAAVIAGLRGVLSGPSSRTVLVRGQRVSTSAKFNSDQADIRVGDTLTDDTTGRTFEVLSANTRYELGIGYTYGDLLDVVGAPS